MKKIVYITGSRADFGIMSPVLRKIDESRELELSIVATGIHVMPEFGDTAKEIEKYGYDIYLAEAYYHSDDLNSSLQFIGSFLEKLSIILEKIRPDIILLLGDRAEALAGAIAGQYLNIAVSHVSGGDLSGHVDNSVRHAISKMSDIHFPISKKSGETLKRMGESEEKIFVCGSPTVDSIKSMNFRGRKDLEEKYNLDLRENYILVIQHPIINQTKEAEEQIRITLDAVIETGIPAVVIYPNADAGGRRIISAIRKYEQLDLISAFENLDHKDYLCFLKNCSSIVGNSSSGIVEASYFGVPCVNIGIRQMHRERAGNVLDVPHDKQEIKNALKKALQDQKFRRRCQNCKSPYGDGKSAERIVRVLEKTNAKELLAKRWEP